MNKQGTQRHSLINAPGVPGLAGGRFTADVPSVHHRFNKDSVHLRSMYRQLYPQHKNSAFIMTSNSKHRLDDSDSENGSRVRSQLRKTNLVKSGEGQLASAASHTRKGSLNPHMMTARTSPVRKGDKINILQNTPAQMQQQRNNFLHASSSICNAMLHTHSTIGSINLPSGGNSR